MHLALISVLVYNYDEAIVFYTEKLNFILVEDTPLSETKRWVVLRPSLDSQCGILLAKAVGEEQKKAIGYQTGGRVFLFLHTDDFDGMYQRLLAHEVKIVRPPSVEAYGTVAVFEDLYGNWWDLIQPIKKALT